jgi:glycosyltransferase involved in cell wall biosynthesis
MGEKPFVSIVIPVLNEEENVEPLYERLRDVLDREASRREILYVDDGSTDATAAKIKALHEKDPSVKLICLSRNFGHQLALTAGLDHAQGDVCVTMDADLQHPPDAIPRFLEKWREGFEVVSGVKTGASKRTWLVDPFSRVFYLLMSWLSDTRIDPEASDFRLFTRPVVAALRATRESTRFLRGLVKWVGFRATTVPYETAERYRGTAKYTMGQRLALARAGIFSFSIIPLRLASLTGVIVAALAFVYAVYSIYAHVVLHQTIQGWTSLIIVVLFLGSLQLLFTGLLGEYLGRVFIEAKQRPLYLVRSLVGLAEDAVPPGR